MTDYIREAVELNLRARKPTIDRHVQIAGSQYLITLRLVIAGRIIGRIDCDRG